MFIGRGVSDGSSVVVGMMAVAVVAVAVALEAARKRHQARLRTCGGKPSPIFD